MSYVSTHRNYQKGTTVPSCRECNTLLNDKMYTTIADRAAYLFNRYHRRYKRLLAFDPWTEEELRQMSQNLRDSILTKTKEQEWLKDRLEFLNCAMSDTTIVKRSTTEIFDCDMDIDDDDSNVVYIDEVDNLNTKKLRKKRKSIKEINANDFITAEQRKAFDDWALRKKEKRLKTGPK